MIVAQREMLRLAQSELTVSRLEIEPYKFLLANARRQQYGQSSERAWHLIEQLELAIEDLEETQAAGRYDGADGRQREASTLSAAGPLAVVG